MKAPNAEQIEGAAEILSRDLATGPTMYPLVTQFLLDMQIKELESAMGAAALKQLGIGYPMSMDFKAGYQLGVQAARVVMAASAILILAGVKPEDVL
jgi:hypothetical protein